MDTKALTPDFDMGDMSMGDIVLSYQRMFVSRNYDWWREVGKDDIVVDIGAGVGLFSAKALDSGAKKVYMIEPSKVLLKTAIKNVCDYIIGNETPVVIPVNSAIGKTDVDLGNVFGSKKRPKGTPEPELMRFEALINRFNIKDIDFLKVTAEGAEFNILTEDHVDFVAMHVRHSAILVHMNAQYGSANKFAKWRDSFLKPFVSLGRVRVQDSAILKNMFEDNYKELLPEKFMVYITNW